MAERLAESIKLSGGNVRLDSPVLRLAYDESGTAIGVDLLSGERVFARKAIVSNLTIWDTYGKLVGLNRTPPEIKKQLNTLHGTGVYVIYAVMEESAVARLPAMRMRVEDGDGEFTMAVSRIRGGRRQTCLSPSRLKPKSIHGSPISRVKKTTTSGIRRRWSNSGSACTQRFRSLAAISRLLKPRTRVPITTRRVENSGWCWELRGSRFNLTKPACRMYLWLEIRCSSESKLECVVESAMSLASRIR